MKKVMIFVLFVLALVVSGCGSLEQPPSTDQEEITTLAAPIGTNPPPPPPPPVPCCGKIKTFILVNGTYLNLDGATNVSVNTQVVIGFSEAQVPNNLRLTISPSVSCSWVWSSDKKYATCASNNPLRIAGYLAYATDYTVKVEKWKCYSWLCFWSTTYTGKFRTGAPVAHF